MYSSSAELPVFQRSIYIHLAVSKAVVLNLLGPVHPYSLDRTPITPSRNLFGTHHGPNRNQMRSLSLMRRGRELYQVDFSAKCFSKTFHATIGVEIVLEALFI